MKKFIVMMGLLTGITSFAAAGLNLPFTSDGKLHEEKLINRNIQSEDTDLKIKKIGNGKYQIISSYSESNSEDGAEEGNGKYEITHFFQMLNLKMKQNGIRLKYQKQL